MTSAADDLDEVADALYALPPADFTAARNARAADTGGERGARIARLRKPSVAAWAVNLLVRDGQLADAVALSRALREAQDDLDAVELARLGRQRRALVAGLARRAVELADAAGASLSAAAVTDVETTVNAAIVDAGVGVAVLTGRLVRTIPQGAEPAQVADAVAGSVPAALPDPPPGDDLAARRSRRAADAAVRAAERAAAEAGRERDRAEARLAAARERADEQGRRRDALRSELERAIADAERAAADAERAEADRDGASERAAHTAAELEQARTTRDGES
jgi:hypothetical protein